MIDIAEVRGWAREAGALALASFNGVAGRRKADRSWVTAADEAVEELLRERIAARHPDHGVVGEEQGGAALDREFVWVLDPIDGTGSFVSGLANWCVSIGLLREGRPHLGVIYLPLLDDCYWADASGPAFRNDQRLEVQQYQGGFDSNDWICVTSTAHRSYRISFPGKARSLGSVAADFCYVARGSAVAGLIGRPKLWDMAAGLAILRGAGGGAWDLRGEPVDTVALLAGSRLAAPLLIGAPGVVAEIRGMVQWLAP